MKRGAEKQLTRDGGASDGEDDGVPQFGMQKADSETLARRPMKGLPKRLGGTPAPINAIASTPLKPSFQFGAGTAGAAQFTFTTPTSTPLQTSSQTPLSFSNAAKPSPPLFPSVPVSSTATSTAKAFATSLGPPPSRASTAPKTLETDYYASLRGLNLALLNEVKNMITQNPFSDMRELVDRYKSSWVAVQKDYDSRRASSSAPQPQTTFSPTFGAKPSSSAPTGMPKPPQSFFGGSSPFGVPTTSSSSESKPTGFVPNLTSAKTNTTSKPGVFAFPAASTSTTENKPTTGFGASIFGNSSLQTPATSIFGGGGTSTATGTTPSIFSGGGGASTAPSENIFGKPGTAAPTTSLFGNGATTVVKTALNTFGDSPSVTPNPFGKPAGASIGFTFTAPKAETDSKPFTSFQPSITKPESDTSTSTTLAAPAASSTLAVKTISPPLSEESRGATPLTEGEGGDSATKPLGTNPNDEEGEGEEDETTTHSCRVKVYKMVLKAEQPSWADHGIGFLRLKKHKTTEARRLLARNSGNGKVMINFNLYSGLSVTRNKNVLSFIGHEDGKKATFRVKVKDEAGATALKQAIDTESSAVKSRESSVVSVA